MFRTLSLVEQRYRQAINQGVPKEELEIEARFNTSQKYREKKLELDGSSIYYERLGQVLRAVKGIMITQEKSVVDMEEAPKDREADPIVRHIVTESNPRKEVWERKRSLVAPEELEQFREPEYGLKLTLNREETINPPNKFEPTLRRDRSRTSYLFPDTLTRVDLTEVTEIKLEKVTESSSVRFRPVGKAATYYSVEVEYLGPIELFLIRFEERLIDVYMWYQGTETPYPLSLKRELSTDLTNILGSATGVLVEARNLKKRDLVYGGIVGNSRVIDPNDLTHRPNLVLCLQGVNLDQLAEGLPGEQFDLKVEVKESRTETGQIIKDTESKIIETVQSNGPQRWVTAQGRQTATERTYLGQVDLPSRADQNTLPILFYRTKELSSLPFNATLSYEQEVTSYQRFEWVNPRAKDGRKRFLPYLVRLIRRPGVSELELIYRGGYTDDWKSNLATVLERILTLITTHLSPPAQWKKMHKLLNGLQYSPAHNGTRYMVTYKADGQRKMLVVHRSGIWLIYPPFEYNLVFSKKFLESQKVVDSKILLEHEGTILDGELVPAKNNPLDLYYLAFDCLSSASSANKNFLAQIQNSSYPDRAKITRMMIAKLGRLEDLGLGLLKFRTKEWAELPTPELFFATVARFLADKNKQFYPEDGLMFVPLDAVYNPRNQKRPLTERKLTKVPDTCKWKDQRVKNDITIDFVVKETPQGKIELYSWDTRDVKGLVRFTGTKINPLTDEMIDHSHPMTKSPSSGAVFEYEWNGRLLTPRRARPDKIGRPNSKEVAEDNWDSIHDPISQETLLGQNLALTFSYHNRIKRDLYRQVKPSLILDIGSGMGGDVSKWEKSLPETAKIIAVEPDANNREQLVKRVALHHMTKRIEIVPTTGQDTATIVRALGGRKADVISLMLSLSFFWSSDEVLEGLIRTVVSAIAPQGQIIFLTVDGDAVEQLFRPALGGEITTVQQIGPAQFTLHPPNVVDVVLPGTIVGNQREYLVRLTQFQKRLTKYGFRLDFVSRADQELLLTPANRLFSSLYSYGMLTSTQPQLLVPPVVHLSVAPFSGQSVQPSGPTAPITVPVVPRTGTVTTSEQNKEMNHLPWLSVRHLQGRNPVNGPAINDDTYAPLTTSVYPNLYRIAVIGDNSCLLHAVLKGIYPRYQQEPTAQGRIVMAQKVRRDLAVMLARPSNNGHSYWASINNSAFPRMVSNQLPDTTLRQEGLKAKEIDYSLNGLQRLLDSHATLGQESIEIISTLLDIDIYLLRATKEQAKLYVSTRKTTKGRLSIILVWNGSHYEIVADNQFQVCFPPTHPLIEAIVKSQPSLLEDLDKLSLPPPIALLEGLYVMQFSLAEFKQFDQEVNQTFLPIDPYRQLYDQVRRIILRIASRRSIRSNGITNQFFRDLRTVRLSSLFELDLYEQQLKERYSTDEVYPLISQLYRSVLP